MSIITAQNSTPSAFCEYLQSAYISGVELSGDTTSFETLRTTSCQNYFLSTLQNVSTIDENDNHIVSTSWSQQLIGLLNTAKNLSPPLPTFEELNDIATEKNTCRYYSYQVLSNENFWAIANANLSGTSVQVFPASSTIVFEIDAQNNVSAWLNDE